MYINVNTKAASPNFWLLIDDVPQSDWRAFWIKQFYFVLGLKPPKTAKFNGANFDDVLIVMDAFVYHNQRFQKSGKHFNIVVAESENNLPIDAFNELFESIQAFNAKRLLQVGFQVSISKATWDKLNFDNKSHFRDYMS